MATPLKNHFGPEIPHRIAAMIRSIHPKFPSSAFTRDALDGFGELDLTARGWKIARTLRSHMPDDYARSIAILMASLGPKLEKTEGNGMGPFLYLPHVFFVAEFGLDHFDDSMRAQYELTQRFTAEFSIRPFLERHPEATLARLAEWTNDPSEHVRRLVSEGTRPRLPWAPRLRGFQKDPRPVLELLELLKDDPSLYVRRSVANNLNDIGKDHPALLVATAQRWLIDASEERRWLVQHALRSAVKRADAGTLALLGFGKAAKIAIRNASVTPGRVAMGKSVVIALEVASTATKAQRVLVDLCIHFVKANGKTSPKVFKLKTVDLGSGESVRLEKRISLADMTTRKHYPGTHRVEVVINGRAEALGEFRLVECNTP